MSTLSYLAQWLPARGSPRDWQLKAPNKVYPELKAHTSVNKNNNNWKSNFFFQSIKFYLSKMYSSSLFFNVIAFLTDQHVCEIFWYEVAEKLIASIRHFQAITLSKNFSTCFFPKGNDQWTISSHLTLLDSIKHYLWELFFPLQNTWRDANRIWFFFSFDKCSLIIKRIQAKCECCS